MRFEPELDPPTSVDEAVAVCMAVPIEVDAVVVVVVEVGICV